MNNDEMITVSEIMSMCDVSRTVVTRWIRDGYITGIKKNPEKRNSPYVVDINEFKKFVKSDKYYGHPADIAGSRIFNRNPQLEDCWPYNLLIGVLRVKLDSEEGPTDIFEYDIREFKNLIGYLSERDQQVLRMRYINGMTLEEIGMIFGLTRERIRMIQETSERKLRHWIAQRHCKVVSYKKYNDVLQRNHILLLEVERLNRLLSGPIKTIDSVPVSEREAADSAIDVSIFDLNLSIRPLNCLNRYGLKTVGDLIAYDQNQDKSGKTWYDIRNFGRRSLFEVATKMFENYHYRLRDYDKKTKKYTEMDIPLTEETNE